MIKRIKRKQQIPTWGFSTYHGYDVVWGVEIGRLFSIHLGDWEYGLAVERELDGRAPLYVRSTEDLCMWIDGDQDVESFYL